MLHKSALEPIGFSAFLGTEGDELETAIHGGEDGRPAVLKTVEKLDTTLVEEPFPQGLATLVCVDTTGYYDAHMPVVSEQGEELLQEKLKCIDMSFPDSTMWSLKNNFTFLGH